MTKVEDVGVMENLRSLLAGRIRRGSMIIAIVGRDDHIWTEIGKYRGRCTDVTPKFRGIKAVVSGTVCGIEQAGVERIDLAIC